MRFAGHQHLSALVPRNLSTFCGLASYCFPARSFHRNSSQTAVARALLSFIGDYSPIGRSVPDHDSLQQSNSEAMAINLAYYFNDERLGQLWEDLDRGLWRLGWKSPMQTEAARTESQEKLTVKRYVKMS
jgi:hypothetical protein